jgi:hypothetical protein
VAAITCITTVRRSPVDMVGTMSSRFRTMSIISRPRSLRTVTYLRAPPFIDETGCESHC